MSKVFCSQCMYYFKHSYELFKSEGCAHDKNMKKKNRLAF